jgi:hypothetical protein
MKQNSEFSKYKFTLRMAGGIIFLKKKIIKDCYLILHFAREEK